MKRSISLICTLLSTVALMQAQTKLLSKSEAAQLTLENNYGIKISENNVKIAENNKSILNTGFLPTLIGSGGLVYNIDDTEATFANGNVTTLEGAESNRYNAALNLNYTLFDGLGRHYNYKQLKEQYNLSELQARETIENTLLQLFSVYYNVAQLSENVALQQQSLLISKDRYKRVAYQFDYGQTNKLSVLNAQVDVNNDSIALLNTKQQYLNAKRDLFVVMGKNEGPNFEVDTVVILDLTPAKEELYARVKKNNVALLPVSYTHLTLPTICSV